MTIPILKPVWLPRPANKRAGCYPLGFEKYIPNLLRTKHFVHFFSGFSNKGVCIDIDPECDPDIIGNVESIPQLKDNTFYGGMADPPYNEEFARKLYNQKYPKWTKWTKELVRLVKVGGYVAIMQNYIVPKLHNCEYVEIFPIMTRIKQFPKIVTVQRRIE